MKKLMLLFVLILFAIPACAQTAESPLSVEATLSAAAFSAPGPVEVSITVTNTSGQDKATPCALYGPTGVRERDFGQPVLAAGESVTWHGVWQVTQEHIDSGRIPFALVSYVPDVNGMLRLDSQPCFIAITRAVAEGPIVSVVLNTDTFTEPGIVHAAVAVTAPQDMPGPCALYGPDGERIAEFGTPTLAASESATWQGTWQVTQEHIDSGRIRIVVIHHVLKNGQLIAKQQPYDVLLRPATQPHVAVTLSNAIFTAPGPVDVTITVTNTSGADMPGPCALYAPDGMRITGFGTPTLAAGESATWQGTWQVTAYMLDEGRINFALVTAGTNADDPSALAYHHSSVSIIDLRDPLGLLTDAH